jgi:methyl-accepting chemotaxis protein
MGRSLRIREKLAVYIVLLIVVAVVCVTIPASYYFSASMERVYEQNAVKGMEGLNSLIENYKKEAANYGAGFVKNTEVVRAVEAKDAAAVVRVLTPLIKEAKLDFATVTDEKGVVIARTHETKKGDSVTSQANVRMALQGSVFATVEPGTVVKLAARAGVPVKNAEGRIVGVVSVGYVASRDELADRTKSMFGTEATLFAGDERVSTTIVQDGKRVVGTKLNEQIAAAVLGQGQKYLGKAEILGEDYATSYMPLMGPDNKPVGVIFAGESLAAFKAERARIFTIIGVIALCIIALGIFCAMVLAKSISGAINNVVAGAAEVAAGDLTRRVAVKSRDELGILATNFNEMVEHLDVMVRRVDELAETLAASSQQLTASAEQSAQAAGQVAASITEVAAGAEKQLGAVSVTAETVGQMSADVRQMAADAKAAAELAGKTADSAGEGGRAVETAVSQMARIEATVNESAAVIAKLGEQSKEIGQIIDTITGIAGQTNLLALNAAIEAARAGEQGRGFAVVAEEVRKLAEQSEQAAGQIAALIGAIQTDTQQAVAAMGKGTKEVGEGAQMVNAAGEAFHSIAKLADEVSGRAGEISTAVSRMAGGSEQTVKAVEGIKVISQDTMGLTQTVSAATEEQSASLEEIASSSRELANMAGELQAAVTRFKV